MNKSSTFCEKDAQKDYPTKQNPSFPDADQHENDYIGDDDDYDGDESEEVDHNSSGGSSRHKNGSSSSNSTVEETSEKKASGSGSVRPYVRSKNPRLRWTPDLHLRFVQAIERLGGQERATPKLVLQLMNIKGLSISHVKSHLQMFRSKKFDDPNQEQGILSEGDDHHIFHLSQLPMLQSYNQSSLSKFRYHDGLWSPQASINYNPFVGGLRQGVYGSMVERILARNNIGNDHSSFKQEHTSWRSVQSNHVEESKMGLLKNNADGLSMLNQFRRNNILMDNKVIIKDREQEKRVLKRKETDQESEHLDLNLSLEIKIPKQDITNGKKGKEGFDENDLSLSLFSPITNSNSSSISRSKHAKTMDSSGASLDLTL